MGSAYDDKPKAGLRERKKARTRAEIQRQALRLFRERGYEATTAAQIAEAADVALRPLTSNHLSAGSRSAHA